MIFINAFGKGYEIDVLPREEIEKIIDDIDWDELVRKTWDQHPDFYGRTEARLWLDNGEITFPSFTTGSGSIEQHFITLYEIPQNVVANSFWEWNGDILNEEEYETAQKMIENEEATDLEDAMEKMGIDFNERFADFLVYCELECGELDLSNIKMQLDSIYNPEKIYG